MTKETQLALVNGSALTESDVMSAIDGVIVQLHQTGSLQEATKVLNILDQIDNVTGHAKAKLLWGMEIWWRRNKEDDFGDYVESTSGTKRVTVLRYLNVQECIEQEYIPKSIQSHPMRDLIPIANMLSQGYEPSKKQWDEIHLASNNSEILEVIREIKGKKPRKSGLKIYLEKDGSLNVWKNNKKTYVGFLDLEEAKINPDVEKAIERLVNGAQIIRR